MSALRARDFDVVEAATGAEALDRALDAAPDVVLLDLGLPDIDGIEVCRRVLAQSALPVIIVSAEGDEERTLTAFELGAVDYVRKPFSTPVLVARIGVALRGHAQRTPVTGTREVGGGGVEVDLLGRQARVGSVVLDVSGRQFDLLALFVRNEGRLLTQTLIQTSLWGPGSPDRSTSLRNLVSGLRRELQRAGARGTITTEAGMGYRWDVAGG